SGGVGAEVSRRWWTAGMANTAASNVIAAATIQDSRAFRTDTIGDQRLPLPFPKLAQCRCERRRQIVAGSSPSFPNTSAGVPERAAAHLAAVASNPVSAAGRVTKYPARLHRRTHAVPSASRTAPHRTQRRPFAHPPAVLLLVRVTCMRPSP